MATDTNSTDGRQLRKRRPRPTVGDAHTSKRSEAMRRRYQDPAQREASRQRMLRMKAQGKMTGRPLGVWDGYTKEQCARIHEEAKAQAAKTIQAMKDKGMIAEGDDPRAVEALEAAITVLREPQSQGTKLQAAKLILEYTKSKPASETKVTVNKAEEWLAAIAEDDGSDEDGVSADDAETPA